MRKMIKLVGAAIMGVVFLIGWTLLCTGQAIFGKPHRT
jgi:hypothetical protein